MRQALDLARPVLILLLGVGILALSSAIGAWLTAAAFILFNCIIANQIGLLGRLKSRWSPLKIHHVLIGCWLGLVPWAIYWLSVGPMEWEAMGALTWNRAAGTFAIVLWEELWFRGVALEMAALRFTEIGAVVLFAGLFVLLHLLNPEIHLVTAAPGLFLAGYVLGSAYFSFGTLWAPVGIHLAHNLLASVYPAVEGTPVHNIGLILVAIPLTAVLVQRLPKTNLLTKEAL